MIITKKKDVTVYFRVSDVFRDVIVNVYGDGKLILSKKKKKVAPGEMETVLIRKELLEGIGKLEVKLEG